MFYRVTATSPHFKDTRFGALCIKLSSCKNQYIGKLSRQILRKMKEREQRITADAMRKYYASFLKGFLRDIPPAPHMLNQYMLNQLDDEMVTWIDDDFNLGEHRND